jgi:hypothetical protein
MFSNIYESRAWGDGETVSGPGSTLEYTAAFRDDLARLLRELGTRTLLDVPCGDFNWMGEVVRGIELGIERGIELYIGADVVPGLIERNQIRHADPARTFLHLDITAGPLPQADVILCRDCLVHFSLEDVDSALRCIKESGATWLITTTFTGPRENEDIPTGYWRPLNLERPPFNFPPPLRLIDEKCQRGDGAYADKHLALWKIAELPVVP